MDSGTESHGTTCTWLGRKKAAAIIPSCSTRQGVSRATPATRFRDSDLLPACRPRTLSSFRQQSDRFAGCRRCRQACVVSALRGDSRACPYLAFSSRLTTPWALSGPERPRNTSSRWNRARSSRRGPGLPRQLPLEIPPDRVTYTNWIGHPQRKRLRTASRNRAPRGVAAIEALARRAYFALMMPDQEIRRVPFAWRAAHEAVRRSEVDIILASASPFTSLLVADTIAR